MTNSNLSSAEFKSHLFAKINGKTKPVGSLGKIEKLAKQIAISQHTLSPVMNACRLTIFAGDHGMANAGVSAFPQIVTQQMVLNFLSGGAAANVFARSNNVKIQVVDAGVAGDPINHPHLISHRIASGTKNAITESAMTKEQAQRAIVFGKNIGNNENFQAECFGEMGIGNTSSATLIAHKILGLSLDTLTGRGTGLDDAGLARKRDLLKQAANRTTEHLSPMVALQEYGGFEIAMMVGAMIGAAESEKIVIVDGFIATSAALIAQQISPAIKQNLVFAHVSEEQGHIALLDAIGAKPLLNLEMRLGEGTGALLAWPLVKAAAAMLNEMASFESASVSNIT